MDPKSFFERITDHATDPVFQHLRTNHFPIILAMVGFVAAILACVIRKDAIWKYAKVTMLLAAVTAPLAYWTGERALDKAEGFENIDQASMGDHEETAEAALVCLLVCGAAAGVALVKPNTATRALFVVTALAAAGATAYTSAIAGNIVHGPESLGSK